MVPQEGRLTVIIHGTIDAPYNERKTLLLFVNRGQRSSVFTRGLTVKMLTWYFKLENLDRFHTWYTWIPHSESKISIFFGGGQSWSSGVIISAGQNLNTLLTRYFKVESLDRFHTRYADTSWLEKDLHIFGRGHLGSLEVKLWKTFLTWYFKVESFS